MGTKNCKVLRGCSRPVGMKCGGKKPSLGTRRICPRRLGCDPILNRILGRANDVNDVEYDENDVLTALNDMVLTSELVHEDLRQMSKLVMMVRSAYDDWLRESNQRNWLQLERVVYAVAQFPRHHQLSPAFHYLLVTAYLVQALVAPEGLKRTLA